MGNRPWCSDSLRRRFRNIRRVLLEVRSLCKGYINVRGKRFVYCGQCCNAMPRAIGILLSLNSKPGWHEVKIAGQMQDRKSSCPAIVTHMLEQCLDPSGTPNSRFGISLEYQSLHHPLVGMYLQANHALHSRFPDANCHTG